MQFYDITILIFGLSERDGLILDQCAGHRSMKNNFLPTIYGNCSHIHKASFDTFAGAKIYRLFTPDFDLFRRKMTQKW